MPPTTNLAGSLTTVAFSDETSESRIIVSLFRLNGAPAMPAAAVGAVDATLAAAVPVTRTAVPVPTRIADASVPQLLGPIVMVFASVNITM